MRILYITLENLSLHKGSVTHVKEIVAGLRKRGHQVGLIGRPWNSIAFSSFSLLVSLFIKLPQYDIIYARDYHTTILALLPRLLFRKKLIYEINGLASEEQKLKGRFLLNRVIAFIIGRAEKIAAKNSDRIVSVTPQIASHLITHFNRSPKEIKIIGNGVNTELFRPINDQTLLEKWRRSIGVEMDEMVAIFVGNLARWQGVDVLIESGLQLLPEGQKMKFLIVGNGPLKADLMRRVSRSEFKSHFIFIGMMDYKNIPFLINISDFCIAPFILKRNEKTGVSPLKIFEYMACGKPIVASRIEGLEFIEKEGIGCLIEPENAESLKKGLSHLIQEPQERIRMGERGLTIARENCSWESRANEIENVIKELA